MGTSTAVLRPGCSLLRAPAVGTPTSTPLVACPAYRYSQVRDPACGPCISSGCRAWAQQVPYTQMGTRAAGWCIARQWDECSSPSRAAARNTSRSSVCSTCAVSASVQRHHSIRSVVGTSAYHSIRGTAPMLHADLGKTYAASGPPKTMLPIVCA